MSGAVTLSSHPLVRQTVGDRVVIDASADVVGLDPDLADVLARTAAAGSTPMLLTPSEPQVTFAARYMTEILGGTWLVADADARLHSPTTGQVHWAPSGPHRQPRADGSLGWVDLPPAPTLNAGFSVAIHHAATESLELGALAELVALELGDDSVAGWDVHEPLLLPWDRTQVTEHARSRMPDTTRLFLVGQHGRFQATMVVRRTTTGVEETLVGLARVPGADGGLDALEAITARARHTLTTVAERCRMPLAASVSAVSGWPDLMQRRGLMVPPIPASLLVGPRATHLLALDIDALGASHHVEAVGRTRMPSVLATFAPRPEGSWAELHSLIQRAGFEKVAVAAGIAEARPARQGGHR